jgi:N6-adenosine-specific RNA methylase IME4
MFPTQRKIELFARNATEGWAVWGNEIENTVNLNTIE